MCTERGGRGLTGCLPAKSGKELRRGLCLTQFSRRREGQDAPFCGRAGNFGGFRTAQTDGDEVLLFVEGRVQQTFLFPVAQRPDHILFGVVEPVRHIRDTGRPAGAHDAQQIEIDLDLRVVRAFHVFVYKQIRHHGGIRAAVAVNGKHCPASGREPSWNKPYDLEEMYGIHHDRSMFDCLVCG